MARQTKFSLPPSQRLASKFTTIGCAPVAGWTENTPASADPGSLLSGQNVWVLNSQLQPRYRLQQEASNNLFDSWAAGTGQNYGGHPLPADESK